MRLNERIRKAFDAVHAEEELKESTRRSVMRQLERRRRPWLSMPRIATVLTVLILMIGLGGYFSYFTEASVISVDINPSIELSVNVYGRVISATGINEDGEALLADVSVDHMDYADAIADLLNSEAVKICWKQANSQRSPSSADPWKAHAQWKTAFLNVFLLFPSIAAKTIMKSNKPMRPAYP